VLKTIAQCNRTQVESRANVAHELNRTAKILSAEVVVKEPGRTNSTLKLPSPPHQAEDNIATDRQPASTL